MRWTFVQKYGPAGKFVTFGGLYRWEERFLEIFVLPLSSTSRGDF